MVDDAEVEATKKLSEAPPCLLGNAVESATPADIVAEAVEKEEEEGGGRGGESDDSAAPEALLIITVDSLVGTASAVIEDGEADRIQNIRDNDSSLNALIRARIDEMMIPSDNLRRSIGDEIGKIAYVMTIK